MKYTLRRKLIDPMEEFSGWEVKELNLEGTELIEKLRNNLINVMEGILDPDIAGKKPDGFLNNLQSGKLGDFSRRYIITAHDQNQVVGLLIGLPKEDQKLHIFSMGVLTEYRGKGVGSALLNKCINDMLKNNIKEIILDVHSENLPAHSLYKKFGFL